MRRTNHSEGRLKTEKIMVRKIVYCHTNESQCPEEEMEEGDHRMLDPPRILHGGKGSKVGVMRLLGIWL